MKARIEDVELVEGNKYAKDRTKPIKMVKFGAPWCGYCEVMRKARTLEKLAEKYNDVELIVVNVEEDEDMADEYEIQAMPAVFFEDEDGFILAEHAGGLTVAELEKLYLKAKAKIKKGKVDAQKEEPAS